ncbi:unnamed protein product [Schistosoma curassoni]|uniref:Uncharacterized protein n=1 Tax=Schistosoma curassoni TaxID=6186 RepID=A0A3P8G082_9TREM|nr:unnamed protein product [Schistosoma curassoni]
MFFFSSCLSTPKSDLSSQFNVVAQLVLVDPVGFQIPYSTTSIISPSSSISPPTAKLSSESNEMHKTGNFTDLIFNYAYECFNQLYFDSNILLDEQRLKHVGDKINFNYSNGIIINCVDHQKRLILSLCLRYLL